MATPRESLAPAAGVASHTTSKTLQLLRRRFRQLARPSLVLAIGLTLLAVAFGIWWLTSLNGLPDIGDPFDVAAYRALSVPDDQNAFTFLKRAHEKLSPLSSDPDVAWAQANPKLREWVNANQQALQHIQ